MRLHQVEPRFVEFIPDALENGVVYISIPYRAVIHLCCCGCGEKISTPLSPAQWSVAYDGERISLCPSVGSGSLPCNSHYVISRNEVRWARPLTKAETEGARRRDQVVGAAHYGAAERQSWWRYLVRSFRRRS